MQGRKPDFIIIGCQKCGTTALRSYLRQHPDIGMPKYELQFFQHNKKPKIKTYYKLFSKMKEKVVGETTPHYIIYEDILDNININLPDVKLIIIVRNPIKRAHSEYWMRRLNGDEKDTFDNAIKRKDVSYIRYSKYATQLKNVFKYFYPKQIMIIKAEELRENKIEALQCVFNFLNVDDSFIPDNLDNKHIGGMPISSTFERFCGFIRNCRGKLLKNVDNYFINKTAYKSISYFLFLFKTINKRKGYIPMTVEAKEYLYNALKYEIDEFQAMTGISWDIDISYDVKLSL